MSADPVRQVAPSEPPKRLVPRPPPGRLDVEGILQTFARHMMYSVAKDAHTASEFDVYQGLALAVWDRLMERWFATQAAYYRSDAKRVYYLSMEFLMGRALLQNILSLGAYEAYREAMAHLGYDLGALAEQEWEAGLGNGGLGRLAACFLDSAATLALPFYGYGIRYEYGSFTQRIQDGWQVEAPDNWLRYRNPWEIARPDALYPVDFYGRVERRRDARGRDTARWVDTEGVMAMAYDTPVAGYRNDTVNTLRLWAAKSTREFDLARFNAGEYVRAVEDKDRSESISKVLYPPDDQYAGKELRLKQQYFFVSATLQDILRRFRKIHADWRQLPDKLAVQLNDTHPAIVIAELLRILLDWEGLDWDSAWWITERVFGYTNHTVLPEALERWPAELLGRLLPRHLEIIEEIDRRLRRAVAARYPGEPERPARMAIIGDDPAREVRMAHLAIVGSHAVNGVAALHSEILRRVVFPDFADLFPGRFGNTTNGITPRRWLLKCNPGLARLVTEAIGDAWITDLEALAGLRPLAEDAGFRGRWAAVKRGNKIALADAMAGLASGRVDPDSLFDCHVKRIHEYKRQLLTILHAIALYHRLRDGVAGPLPPRTVLFAGKAAPGYALAKLIIKLIHAVAERVNGDPVTAGVLRVAFLPNYGVSAAERIFPATELSEHVSTAGTEASGTGNMKAALNGAVLIGTLDGATIEIRDAVGPDNVFTFGHTAEQIAALRRGGYDPRTWVAGNPELDRAVDAIARGDFESGRRSLFQPIVDALLQGDRYFHCADFTAYMACQTAVAAAYARPDDWARMSILSVAGMGPFSSDRAVTEYARRVWGAVPVPVTLDSSRGGTP